ncbi:MAG: DUF3791 domain-containing protein [Prevotellaceae bacterium]|jgi:hypothetical protein|nr:DUF3791 domain-containing protein [Prevotellaceae bacterium]
MIKLKELSNENFFFVYLLEKYAEYKNSSAPEILKYFDSINLTEYINEMYPIYHCEHINNAFDDIDRKIAEIKLLNS